jgi:formate--tetrahydrofolate ligase
MKSDIEIAHSTTLLPISEVAQQLKIGEESLEHYGKYIAKVVPTNKSGKKGKLILVTAITATKSGIGKTTVSIGLALGLNKIGKSAIVALREPSLGPCFGMKGGAAGGGYAQVLPMEKINLHFTGDFHAITSAHNIVAALLDNYVYQRRKEGFSFKEVLWRRVLDVNDRSLRNIVTGLGASTDGIPTQAGFDITPASEIMAAFCLANDAEDLRRRVSKIILAVNHDGTPFTIADLGATGSVMALLSDAINPNLVQTTENTPALIHGGPFANIAHGCNSVIATKLGMDLSDYCITEAGFGADLGAEKFYDIVCRANNLNPDLTIIVATAQGLKMHGGVALEAIKEPNMEGLTKGLANLEKHVSNLRSFGQTVMVVFNRFATDTDEEMNLLKNYCETQMKLPFAINNAFAEGGEGAREMALKAVECIETMPSQPLTFAYELTDSIKTKIEKVAKNIYGAKSVVFTKKALNGIKKAESLGLSEYPICMAKTQFSFSGDAKCYGVAKDFELEIKDIVPNGGAEMVVVIAGDILRMPGLPARPQAALIDYKDGEITGLS